MTRRDIEIDKDKLRRDIRMLESEYVFYMLDDAIDLLPPTKLYKIVKKYLDPKRLRPDCGDDTQVDLLANVKAFEKASRAGKYYDSFDVNSKNFMEKSKGTTGWIAECRRLLDSCAKRARAGDPGEVRQAFEILFSLLDRLDECRDDIIFFADEAGAWQVGVEWEKVFPSWFGVLSATAEPEEYAQRATALIEHHYDHGREKMLAIARRTATPDQRKALADVVERQAGQRRRGEKR